MTYSPSLLGDYQPAAGAYDELFTPGRKPRPGLAALVKLLNQFAPNEIGRRQALVDNALRTGGVTFSVYSDQRGVEKIFPFDVLPRPIPSAEWDRIELGLKQRVQALNEFLLDVYGPRRIVKEGKIPNSVIEGSPGYLRAVQGVKPPGGVYIQIAGIDLVRGADGEFRVLEDNARTPSGVSYVLENRAVMRRNFPRLFARARVRSVDAYPTQLRDALLSLAKGENLALLTPGSFNSAYFEHTFLARRMGCDLVEGGDLFVDHDRVYAKTTGGPKQVHAIYRRINDEFLDPEAFDKTSLLGVPGLFRAYKKGNIVIANALGNGVADDKATYPYVPEMIRFYLGEDPIIKQVETYRCEEEKQCKKVLADLAKYVVKEVDGAGGYGMLVGPTASKTEREKFARVLRANPKRYIAQPLVELSTCPTIIKKSVVPRRVDLRPYIVSGTDTWVLPGGLTRVALREGSYVVNSSQGGGSKDTWVLDRRST